MPNRRAVGSLRNDRHEPRSRSGWGGSGCAHTFINPPVRRRRGCRARPGPGPCRPLDDDGGPRGRPCVGLPRRFAHRRTAHAATRPHRVRASPRRRGRLARRPRFSALLLPDRGRDDGSKRGAGVGPDRPAHRCASRAPSRRGSTCPGRPDWLPCRPRGRRDRADPDPRPASLAPRRDGPGGLVSTLQTPATHERRPLRFAVFAFAAVVMLGGLTARLFAMQLAGNPAGAPAAAAAPVPAGLQIVSEPVPSTRGLIYDRTKHLLGENVPPFPVPIPPADLPLSQQPQVVGSLAGLLGTSATAITTALDSASGSRV